MRSADGHRHLGDHRAEQLAGAGHQPDAREHRSEVSRVGRALQQDPAQVVHRRQADADRGQHHDDDRCREPDAQRHAQHGARREPAEQRGAETPPPHHHRRDHRARQRTGAHERGEHTGAPVAEVERLERHDHEEHVECPDHEVACRRDAEHTDAPRATPQLGQRRAQHAPRWRRVLHRRRPRCAPCGRRERHGGGDGAPGEHRRRPAGPCQCRGGDRSHQRARAVAVRHGAIDGSELAGAAHERGQQDRPGRSQGDDRPDADHDESCGQRSGRVGGHRQRGAAEAQRLESEATEARCGGTAPHDDRGGQRCTHDRRREDAQRHDTDRGRTAPPVRVDEHADGGRPLADHGEEMSDDEATQRSGAHRRGRVPRAPWRAAIHIVVGVPQVTTVMVTTGEWVLPAGSPDRRPRM